MQNAAKHGGPDTTVTITSPHVRRPDAYPQRSADTGPVFGPRRPSSTGLADVTDRL